MKKKIILALVGAMSIFTLAACSNNSDAEIATMKGAKLTVSDFYERAKTEQSSQQVVFDMILSEVFTSKYGDQVTDEMVEDEIKNVFGDNFEEQLKSSGLTRKEVETSIKERLAFQEGLKAHVELTDEDLKAAWDSFHPEVEAQIIAVLNQDEATEIHSDVLADDADFGAIAAEKSSLPSAEDNGNVTFDSSVSVNEVPSEVQQVAWTLSDGQVSDVIPVNSAYGTSYYIIKMVKSQAKGNDMEPFEDTVRQIATDAKLNDSAFTTKAIGQELVDANVKIKDESFSGILTNFIEAVEPQSTDSSEATDDTVEATDDTVEATDETN